MMTDLNHIEVNQKMLKKKNQPTFMFLHIMLPRFVLGLCDVLFSIPVLSRLVTVDYPKD